MKKFWNLIFIIIVIFCISGCTYNSKNNNIISDTDVFDKITVLSETTEVVTVKEDIEKINVIDDITSISIKNTSLNQIGVYSCESGVSSTYQVVFIFYFTNNCGRDCSFDDIYIAKLYQDGMECSQNYTPLALTASELNEFDKNVRSGYTVPVKIGYNVDKLTNLELVILSDGNEIANYYVEIDIKNKEYIIYKEDEIEEINILEDGLYGYYDNIGGMDEFYFKWIEDESYYNLSSSNDGYEETLILYNDNTGTWISGITMQFVWEIKENSLYCTMEDGWCATFKKLEVNDKYSSYDYNSTYQEDSELMPFSPELLEEYLSEYIYNTWIGYDGEIIKLNKNLINDFSYKILNAHGYFYRQFSISFDFAYDSLPNEIHSVYCDLINNTISIDGKDYLLYDN